MSEIYDNWERLVAAVVKKQQLWELFHADSRSPSVLSESSGSTSPRHDLGVFDFGSSSQSHKFLPKQLVLVSDFSPAFDVEDLCVASAELLGRGTFGSAYMAVMDNGARIVVKRLESESVSEQDFKRHMEIVGDVRHENVAALRAYYSSWDERLMLYDYYSKGSVFSLLHGQTDENQAHVDWQTRLKIAIGAARGIAEIHAQLGGTLVHGNIKASNIFLNMHSYGCVSDLGLTNMIKTTFMPTSRCYAPEVKNTQNVSHASDVYSFGILLLELLTSKSSAHVPGGPAAVDLVKLVNSVKSKERAAKVFDVDLLKHPTISKQMVKMLQIGIRCVTKSIKRRPKIFDVVKMLEDIIMLNPLSWYSLEEKLVFFEDADPTYDLKDILRASAEVLGKGTFGTCYKVRLENGNTIVVRRLREVVVTFEDFQQHMEVFGRMRHENVVKLRAYYFLKVEKILKYDYYSQGSVSDLLHGKKRKKGAHRTPLDWGTRVKIAVGAARGIAHIHRSGHEIVHGNIKSSNILLNGKNYGIVSDAGLVKLRGPTQLPLTLFPSYCAPEVASTKKVSQASDVYSFGVVLLELVSGRPSQYTTDHGDVVLLVKWIQSVVTDNEWIGEVFDAEVLKYKNMKAMAQFLQIALRCVSVVPEHRPRMPEVVKVLEKIGGVELSNKTILEDRWELSSVESRLEYLVEDLLPALTQ